MFDGKTLRPVDPLKGGRSFLGFCEKPVSNIRIKREREFHQIKLVVAVNWRVDKI